LYRKYDEQGQTDIVTSWRVLTDMLPSSKGTGTITDWQQGRGALLVGGDARVIRVWDAAREFCISVSDMISFGTNTEMNKVNVC
jgi:regulator-associated protein of mTOR